MMEKVENIITHVIENMSVSMAKLYINLACLASAGVMWAVGLLGAVEADKTEYGLLAVICVMLIKDLIPWLMGKIDSKGKLSGHGETSIYVTIASMKKDVERLQEKNAELLVELARIRDK